MIPPSAEELEKLAQDRRAPAALHRMLDRRSIRSRQPAIHQNNVKRVIRAIEFYRQTGKKISLHNAAGAGETVPIPVSLLCAGYRPEDRSMSGSTGRVDRMMEARTGGGSESIWQIWAAPEIWCPCRDWVIKKSWITCLGRLPLEEAVYILKRDTRHFAKRQLTWFSRERDVRSRTGSWSS